LPVFPTQRMMRRFSYVLYTRNRDVCSENLRRRAVTEVEFAQDGATLVSSDTVGERIWWDVATGARKDKVAGQLGLTKAEIGRYIVKIGRYIVTKKDDLVFVYDTRVGANGGADGEEKVLTAFFRAPSPIVSVSCAGDKIAVGCKSGAVLTLHAAWVTDGGVAGVSKVEAVPSIS
jgi:hypothetical protein